MRWMLLSLVAGAVLLSGCASVATEFESDVDYAKVGRIEAAARTVGVTVYWFNHPIKSSAAN